METILGLGGALEAFDAAKKAGKCRFIAFTGQDDPAIHTALLQASEAWGTVMMPLHAADHAYLSFEETALPVTIDHDVDIKAMKIFGKAFLLRSLNPTKCLRYVLSLPGVHVAGHAGTDGRQHPRGPGLQADDS